MNLKRASQLKRHRKSRRYDSSGPTTDWLAPRTRWRVCKLKNRPHYSSCSLAQANSFINKNEANKISEYLAALTSMHPTAQFELWMKMIDNHSFNLDQLKSLRSAIDDRIKVDIISNVPYEVALHIVSFLSPKDLCLAAQTCRSWRTVCENSRLWRELCQEEGLLEDQQSIQSLIRRRIAKSHSTHEKIAIESLANLPPPVWRSAYLEHINILRNWRTRKFEIKEPFIVIDSTHEDEQKTATTIHGNGSSIDASARQNRVPKQPTIRRRNVGRCGGIISYAQNIIPIHRPPEYLIEMNRQRAERLARNADVDTAIRVPDLQFNEWVGEQTPDISAGRSMMQLRCHEESVITCLQFNQNTNTIVSGSDDTTLKVWCSETGRCISTLKGHDGGVWSSQLSPDDIVISGSTDRTLKIWKARTGQLIHTLRGHTSTVRCLALDGNLVVSGSRDMTLRLWDITEGTCVNVFCGHTQAVRCVEYKNDTIISGAYDNTVRVWDAVSGCLMYQFEDHVSRIYSLQFDGKVIASGSLDSTICIYDIATGQLRHRLVGHHSLTSKMQLRGKILVSANADSLAKIWDIETGACIHTLDGENKHTSAITSVCFNRRHVVTSSDDGTVKLWDLNAGKFIRNMVVLPTASNGGVVWRIRASNTKLICAVGSRSHTEDTHLLVLDFN